MSHRADFFVAAQRILPKHALSRMIGRVAESKRPWLKNILIKRAIAAFNINMQEAQSDSLDDYENFNAFFTRALKKEARPIDSHHNGIACPADGVVSQAGNISENKILQAKGIDYSVSRILGSSTEANHYKNGSFATIYLSPKDYHRVHMPITGKLLRTRYIPGELFSVNDLTAQSLNGLFARNERLVCEFESELAGQFSVIFVGAMLVAGIETVWGGFEQPGVGAVRDNDLSDQSLIYTKGDEIGRFKFGSTIVLLFGKDAASGLDALLPQAPVSMGESIALLK
ncbi:MAG: archaetidylserine decarboxylase [Pseudomonadales bacterium]|nr:phosphatidylserine decarboxylase [SAR92 clade bacterium]